MPSTLFRLFRFSRSSPFVSRRHRFAFQPLLFLRFAFVLMVSFFILQHALLLSFRFFASSSSRSFFIQYRLMFAAAALPAPHAYAAVCCAASRLRLLAKRMASSGAAAVYACRAAFIFAATRIYACSGAARIACILKSRAGYACVSFFFIKIFFISSLDVSMFQFLRRYFYRFSSRMIFSSSSFSPFSLRHICSTPVTPFVEPRRAAACSAAIWRLMFALLAELPLMSYRLCLRCCRCAYAQSVTVSESACRSDGCTPAPMPRCGERLR